MKLKFLLTPFLLMIAIVATLFFQNCGQMTTLNNASFSSFWFDYPYSEKPTVYSEFYFYREAGAGNSGLYKYTFLGAVAPTDGNNASVSYTITFKDQNNKTVCPTITGSSSSIHSECLGVVRSDNILVKMTLTYDGENHVIEKIF